jgi:hypothetical protein
MELSLMTGVPRFGKRRNRRSPGTRVSDFATNRELNTNLRTENYVVIQV